MRVNFVHFSLKALHRLESDLSVYPPFAEQNSEGNPEFFLKKKKQISFVLILYVWLLMVDNFEF